jgi:hypothetical protein
VIAIRQRLIPVLVPEYKNRDIPDREIAGLLAVRHAGKEDRPISGRRENKPRAKIIPLTFMSGGGQDEQGENF